jgi:hypothetical protein
MLVLQCTRETLTIAQCKQAQSCSMQTSVYNCSKTAMYRTKLATTFLSLLFLSLFFLVSLYIYIFFLSLFFSCLSVCQQDVAPRKIFTTRTQTMHWKISIWAACRAWICYSRRLKCLTNLYRKAVSMVDEQTKKGLYVDSVWTKEKDTDLYHGRKTTI